MKKRSPIFLLGLTGLVLAAAFLIAPRLGGSQVPVDERALSAANRLFEAGRYIESAQVLEQILAQGAEDSAVYYNLGNAYYAQGDYARALENYEQAARLAPRDRAIRHNLAVTRAQAPPSPQEAPDLLITLAQLTSSWITINEMSLLLLAFWFAACYFLLASRQLERSSIRSALRIAAAVGVLAVVLMGASLGSRVYMDRTQSGRVEVPTVTAKIIE
ncbi:MAG: tetratricopeptide repeat protein [Anaerolineales bacterium]|nr:tetratricopeptide repeat protein [Anaerolineales bacterium]